MLAYSQRPFHFSEITRTAFLTATSLRWDTAGWPPEAAAGALTGPPQNLLDRDQGEWVVGVFCHVLLCLRLLAI